MKLKTTSSPVTHMKNNYLKYRMKDCINNKKTYET